MLTTATVHWPLGQAPCIVMHTEILTCFVNWKEFWGQI